MTYKLEFFSYSSEKRILSAKESDLYIEGYFDCFPNKGKQFVIRNPETGGFRRFTLEYENDVTYVFSSEDGILCLVYKA